MKKCNINEFRTKAFINGVMHPQPLFIDKCEDCGWFQGFEEDLCVYDERSPVPVEPLIIPDSCPLEDVVIGDSSNTIGVIGVIWLSVMFFVIGVISVLLVLGVVQ